MTKDTKGKVFERWMFWTLGEAFTRTASVAFTNVVGHAISTVGQSFLATLIIGVVQMVGGAGFCAAERQPFWPGVLLVRWCFLFAMFAVAQTVLLFLIFHEGGDMGVTTFIVALSIIPGALADWLLLRRASITSRGGVGILLGVGAAYAALGFPGLLQGIELHWWLLMAVLIMLMITVNQVITVRMREINPHVKNFWVGAFTALLCTPSLFFASTTAVPPELYAIATVNGLCVIGIIVTNLMAYKDDALIATKKLLMFGTFLTFSATVGMLFFGDPFSWGKVAGIILFVPAFYLLQTGKREIA